MKLKHSNIAENIYGFVPNEELSHIINDMINMFFDQQFGKQVSFRRSVHGTVRPWIGFGGFYLSTFSRQIFKSKFFSSRSEAEKDCAAKLIEAKLNFEHSRNLIPGYNAIFEVIKFLQDNNYLDDEFKSVECERDI